MAARRRAGRRHGDVRAAEQPRLRWNLLQGLVVQSANDAALALADGMDGSEAAFVARLQERAKAIGLSRFTVRNATGYAHPEQRVTARDSARLALHMIQNHPERFALFAQREFSWNNIRQTNRNPLLTMNIGADGLMVGMLPDAGFNLVGTAQQRGGGWWSSSSAPRARWCGRPTRVGCWSGASAISSGASFSTRASRSPRPA